MRIVSVGSFGHREGGTYITDMNDFDLLRYMKIQYWSDVLIFSSYEISPQQARLWLADGYKSITYKSIKEPNIGRL